MTEVTEMAKGVRFLLLIALLGASVGAQTKPNFSGTWIVVTPAEGAGQEEVVRHTATTLSTSHASSSDGHDATYKLDGTESRNEPSSR